MRLHAKFHGILAYSTYLGIFIASYSAQICVSIHGCLEMSGSGGKSLSAAGGEVT